MPLTTSSTPSTDAQWHELAASTLETLRPSLDPSSRGKHGAPQPGTAAFAKTVDHTLLKLDADEEGIRRICGEARGWGFKTVCVRSNYVELAKQTLKGSDVLVCSVVCFPEGTQSTDEKIKEGTLAVEAGAAELDFVINYPQLKQGQYITILKELEALRSSFSSVVIKLILETSQLSDLDVVAGCLLAAAAGFDFVKTSTGFNGHGATEHHVALIRAVVEREGHNMGVKASGGIRTAEAATRMLQCGASRLGLSGSVAIVEEGASGGPSESADKSGY